jgi:hypothetical protein
MSVAEAQQRISGWEFAEWQEYFRIRAERLKGVGDG